MHLCSARIGYPTFVLISVLLLAFTTAAASSAETGQGMPETQQQSQSSCSNGGSAQQLFEFWASRAVNGTPPLAKDVNAISMYEALKQTGLVKNRCLVLYRFSVAEREVIWSEEEWEMVKAREQDCEWLNERVRLLPYLFHLVLHHPMNAVKFTVDFAWYVDVADGHRPTPALYPHMQDVPILTFSKSPISDNYSIPMVDTYAAQAWTAHHGGWRRNATNSRRRWAEGLKPIFYHTLPTNDWQSMEATAVLRATCYGTYHVLPDRDDKINARGDLCVALSNHTGWPQQVREAAAQLKQPLFDIGMRRDQVKQCRDNATACSECVICQESKPMDKMRMRQFRYQIVIDGASAPFDSSAWKLDSGSATFMLQHTLADGSVVPSWQLWWYPLLKDGVHVIESTASALPSKVLACIQAEDGCRSIGATARALMLEHLTWENAERYMYLVLKHVHDMFMRAEEHAATG